MSKAYHAKESSGVPAAALVGIGIALVLLGGYASTHGELGLAGTFEALEKQGIPILLGKTISTIGVFLILFPVIKFFFLTPLSEAIDDRNSNLEQTFSEAESLRAEMTTMRNDYESRLTAAESSAREHIEAQIKEAQNLRQTLMNEAANRADAMIEKAQQEIASEKERVLSGLRTQVVDLSLKAAERIVGENMDTDRNRKLVDEFVNGLEVAR